MLCACKIIHPCINLTAGFLQRKHLRNGDQFRPIGFQEFQAPRFPDNRHMVVRLLALRTGRLYAQGHDAAGRITSMKYSNDTVGNRTRDLPACSAVPQPAAPPRARRQCFGTLPTKVDCAGQLQSLE